MFCKGESRSGTIIVEANEPIAREKKRKRKNRQNPLLIFFPSYLSTLSILSDQPLPPLLLLLVFATFRLLTLVPFVYHEEAEEPTIFSGVVRISYVQVVLKDENTEHVTNVSVLIYNSQMLLQNLHSFAKLSSLVVHIFLAETIIR